MNIKEQERAPHFTSTIYSKMNDNLYIPILDSVNNMRKNNRIQTHNVKGDRH
jgi:hypothetical protein